MESSSQEKYKIQRLDLKIVFISSFDIYKRGFKQYIKLSAIYFVLFVISSTFRIISNELKTDSGLALMGLFELVYFIAMYIVIIRIAIAYYLLTESIISNKEFSAKETFTKAKEFFWRFIWKSILYSLFISIPMFIAFVVFSAVINDVLKYFFLSVLFVFLVIVATKYFFVPICAVLEDRKEKCFAKSERIVTGDFWKILLLMIILSIPIAPYQIYIYVINNINELSDSHLFLTGILNQSLSLFITPYISIVTVAAYFLLKRNKKIG